MNPESAAWIAAPCTTAKSGSTPSRGVHSNMRSTKARTQGMRVAPPTSTTSSSMPRSFKSSIRFTK